jgi:hypothetical protein
MSYYLKKIFRILGFGDSIDPLVEQERMAKHITGSDLDEENHSFDPEFMLKYNHPKYEIQKFDSSAKEIERLKKEIQMIEASNQILISELHEKIKNLTLENSELKNKCERIIW